MLCSRIRASFAQRVPTCRLPNTDVPTPCHQYQIHPVVPGDTGSENR